MWQIVMQVQKVDGCEMDVTVKRVAFRPASEKELAENTDRPFRSMKETFIMLFKHRRDSRIFKITAQYRGGWMFNLHEPTATVKVQQRVDRYRMGDFVLYEDTGAERVIKQSSGSFPIGTFFERVLLSRVRDPRFVASVASEYDGRLRGS